MANNYFNFKTFGIQQEGCAMKVCTDSCLFGAWVANHISTKEHAPENILDIGAGTGLLTLMLAQKTEAAFVAIEIDKTAVTMAKENVLNAMMQNHMEIMEADFLLFDFKKKFDLIISNPPFYDNDLNSPNEEINMARHQNRLTIESLAMQCATVVNDDGEIALLAPFKREEVFVEAMQKVGFLPQEICRVKHHSNRPFIRSMMIFRKQATTLLSSEIVIRDHQNNYSSRFVELLSDYYLDL